VKRWDAMFEVRQRESVGARADEGSSKERRGEVMGGTEGGISRGSEGGQGQHKTLG